MPNTYLAENRKGHSVDNQSHPSKGTTCTDDAEQSAIKRHLGLHNIDDMFLDDVHPFLAHYLPTNITDAEIDACVSELLSGHTSVLTRSGKKHSWNFHCHQGPEVYGRAEHEAFRPLGKIIEQIMKYNPRKAKASPHFTLCPNNWLVSDVTGGKFKIDACFLDIPQRKVLETRHIYLPIGLTQEQTTVSRITAHENALGVCHHLLTEDPRRMWIFGLTFERHVVSIWYFSRSHSVKTLAANWVEDPHLLVRIILSFVNANNSMLGIDPMVHVGPRSDDGKAFSYIYEVPRDLVGAAPVFYKTGKMRSPTLPMCIAGRVTRVWEVTQVTAVDGKIEVNPGKNAVLKDVWVPTGTSTETENVDRIFEAVDTFVSTRLEEEILNELKQSPGIPRQTITSNEQTMQRLMKQLIEHEKLFQPFDHATKERLRGYFTDKSYRSLFLNKLYDWKGLTSQELEVSAQSCPNLFSGDLDSLTHVKYSGKNEPSVPESIVCIQQGNTLSSPVESLNQSASSTKEDAQSSCGYVSRQQARVVYEEVCESLYEVKTLGDVVDILCQAIDAVHILYAAGWVHRDLSAGNILAVRTGPNQTWSLKLADFEFARLMIDEDRKVRSDPRTGTAFFMPTEILWRLHLYEQFFAEKDPNPFVNQDGVKTLATQFQLSSTHPTFLKFEELCPIHCFNGASTLPPDADPGKIPARESIVNHNFQHDLESIWWILLWFVTMNVDYLPSFHWAHNLFNHDVEQFQDRNILFNRNLTSGRSISKYLRSELVPTFPQLLESLRSDMFKHYVQREIFGQLELPESYSEIHGKFSQAFGILTQMDGSWRSLAIKSGVNPKVMNFPVNTEEKSIATGSKHGREEDEPRRTRSWMSYGIKKTKTGN